jgi:surfeit locus 1 family protein
MASVHRFHIRFTPNWYLTILAGLFIILFLRLGFWQLHRAEEKKQMIVAEASSAAMKPTPLDLKNDSVKAYQRIIVEGYYLSHVFLFDNQHYQHQFGYDVLSPLMLANGRVIMIDRGWVPGDVTRQTFPEPKPPKERVTLQGTVYVPSNKQWTLGPSLEEKGPSLTVIETLDHNLFTQVLQKNLYPFIIRLDKQDGHGFVRDWKVVSMPPERHRAYAMQWFAMALVLVIIYVVLTVKKNNEETNH